MSKYLGKAIASTLLLAGAAAMYAPLASATPTIPGPEVTGPWFPLDPCDNPIDNSCIPDGQGPEYGGDPNPGGDGGEDGGDYGEEFERKRLEECAELTEKGLPEGCNRGVAESGTPIPNLNVPSSLELLFNYAPGRQVARQREAVAQESLSACYAEVTIPPSECEIRYTLAVAALWNGTSLNAQFRGYLNDAVANLQNRFNNTESDRYWAGFFEQYTLGFSWYNIGFDSSVFSLLFSQGQYNQALVLSRQQKQCNLWFRQWDMYDCETL